MTRRREIERVCYLVQGRIAPFFESLVMGMATITVASAVTVRYVMG
jgi:hypothetical protein